MTGGIYINPGSWQFLPLPARYDGFVVPIFLELAGIEFNNSHIMSEDLQKKIIEQEPADIKQHDDKKRK